MTVYNTKNMNNEIHPLEPFLPQNAKILMLGSFPPPKKRWCMDFFYPNWNNDFWRVWGFIIYNDKNFFAIPDEKRFDKEKIKSFCHDYNIALYDTAEEIIRQKNNASDNFLQIVRATDISLLLRKIPECHTLVTTGQKSATTLQSVINCAPLTIGEYTITEYAGRKLNVWRMPSTSRAYPRSIEWKASYYKKILENTL